MGELERLRDRVAELEDAMGLTAKIPRDLVPRSISPNASTARRLIGILLARPFGDREALYNAMYGARPESDWPQPRIFDVLICAARKALKPHDIIIHTERGRGWYMDEANKTKLRALIKTMEAA